jgi:hypothetical protein
VTDPFRGKLLVCTPVYGHPDSASVSLAYLKAWMAVCKGVECLPPRHFTNCDLVRGRSRAVRMALEYGASHLLFWDADVGGESVPDVLRSMVAERVDFIAAPYPRKLYRGEGRDTISTHVASGHVGMGFTLLSRACMARMVEAYRTELTFGDLVDDKVYPTVALFQLMILNGTLLGEDYSFCQRWQMLGGRVYLVAGEGLPLDHVGGHVYR